MNTFGLQGYLAVITSAAENTFAFSKVGAQAAWFGFSDAATEGLWQYETGPLAGTVFSQGQGNANVPIGGHYTNWNGGEPNNAGGEDFAQFLSSGQWNDLNETNNSPQGYVVEFGGSPNDPATLQLTSSATVNILNIGSISPNAVPVGSPDTTITLAGTGFVNGAVVKFNGTPLATTFVNGGQLTAVVPAADLAAGGSNSITVVNPDGTISGPQTLTVQTGLQATLSGGNLSIVDSGGLNNAITVSKDVAGNYVITDSLQIFIQAPAGATLSNGNHTMTIPSALVTGNLTVNTAAGLDSLTVDYTGAGGFFTTPIVYHGGNNAGDTLLVKSSAVNKATETYTGSGPGASGSLLFDPTGTNTTTDTITYDGVNGAPIDLTNSPIANLTLNLPAGGTSASLEDDGTSGNGNTQLRNTGGTLFGTTKFKNPTSLAINPGAATDTLTVQSVPDLAANTAIGQVGSGFASVSVAGTVALGGSSFSAFGNGITTSGTIGAGTVALTASQNLQVGAAIAATGAANLSFGQGGTGGVATIRHPSMDRRQASPAAQAPIASSSIPRAP